MNDNEVDHDDSTSNDDKTSNNDSGEGGFDEEESKLNF
jgi:hypothetical protein